MVKKRTNNGKKEIIKNIKISKEEFNNLLNTSNIITKIQKNRISFIYNKQYFRLDIFNNSPNIILEIEATQENQKVDIPIFLTILKDITNDKDYQNINILTQKNKTKVKTKKSCN